MSGMGVQKHWNDNLGLSIIRPSIAFRLQTSDFRGMEAVLDGNKRQWRSDPKVYTLRECLIA